MVWIVCLEMTLSGFVTLSSEQHARYKNMVWIVCLAF